jgi:hypothetical protein
MKRVCIGIFLKNLIFFERNMHCPPLSAFCDHFPLPAFYLPLLASHISLSALRSPLSSPLFALHSPKLLLFSHSCSQSLPLRPNQPRLVPEEKARLYFRVQILGRQGATVTPLTPSLYFYTRARHRLFSGRINCCVEISVS